MVLTYIPIFAITVHSCATGNVFSIDVQECKNLLWVEKCTQSKLLANKK